jgi:predicted RNase H-like nuclease (RuvC/YqgF family)
MGYYYSKRIGLVEREKSKNNTPDSAYIQFYKTELIKYNNEIETLKNTISKREDSIEKLDEEFKFLKEKYPEEFL